MNDGKLQMLVATAVALDRAIREKEKELKAAKKALIKEAASRKDEHVETDGGGTSWVATGTDGCVARVTFPAPTLKSKIDGEGKTIVKIRDITCSAFYKLFEQIPAYRPNPMLRTLAPELLAPPQVRGLLKLVTNDSEPRVAFETKDGEQ